MTLLSVQRRLTALGFQPGPHDGLFGRLTRSAVRAFQKSAGLTVDGVPGPNTLKALSAVKTKIPKAVAPPWLAAARSLMGVREVRGRRHSAVIMGWARRFGLAYESDETPWCGLFTAHCVGLTLPEEPIPANPLGARKWQTFGTRSAPTEGALMVFWRGSVAGWQGHVGFYVGEDKTAFHILGGNQSNSVSIARLPRARLLATRWPLTWPKPQALRIAKHQNQPLSTNEA